MAKRFMEIVAKKHSFQILEISRERDRAVAIFPKEMSRRKLVAMTVLLINNMRAKRDYEAITYNIEEMPSEELKVTLAVESV